MISPQVLCAAVMAMNMPNADFACEHMSHLIDASAKYKIKPEVLVSLIHEESRWKPHVVSRRGACGLTQILPKYTRPYTSCAKLKDPLTSIALGAKTLSVWVRTYGKGRYHKGLCGYNGGYRCKELTSPKKYASRVLARAARILREVKKQQALRELRN
jgi:soluble lytic murein transglycosylase-like protein